MSDQLHRIPRRRPGNCCRDYYHLATLRDRLCAGATQQMWANSGSRVTPCGRCYLRPEFSLLCSMPDLTQWSSLAAYGKTY
jgi:hypothetical protein